MLGEQGAVVSHVQPWDVHGVAHVDVTLTFSDGAVEVARLGRESVPNDLHAGERVLVSKAMNVVIEIRRAAG